MKIKCYNKKCGHERDYKGKFTEDNSLITCTKCRHKLRLGKAKIKDEVGIPHTLPHEVTSLPHAELKEEKPQEDVIIEAQEGQTNFCEPHNLPASYDSFEKKWLCQKCLEFETPNARPLTNNIGIVRAIQKERTIKILPRDPLRTVKSQENYFY